MSKLSTSQRKSVEDQVLEDLNLGMRHVKQISKGKPGTSEGEYGYFVFTSALWDAQGGPVSYLGVSKKASTHKSLRRLVIKRTLTLEGAGMDEIFKGSDYKMARKPLIEGFVRVAGDTAYMRGNVTDDAKFAKLLTTLYKKAHPSLKKVVLVSGTDAPTEDAHWSTGGISLDASTDDGKVVVGGETLEGDGLADKLATLFRSDVVPTAVETLLADDEGSDEGAALEIHRARKEDLDETALLYDGLSLEELERREDWKALDVGAALSSFSDALTRAREMAVDAVATSWEAALDSTKKATAKDEIVDKVEAAYSRFENEGKLLINQLESSSITKGGLVSDLNTLLLADRVLLYVHKEFAPRALRAIHEEVEHLQTYLP